MPSTATVIAGTVFALIAVFAGYIYIVGIPPELKREIEKKALRTMGEVSRFNPSQPNHYAESLRSLEQSFLHVQKPTRCRT